MIDKETALKIRKHALEAIIELHSIFDEVRGRCSVDDFETIKRGVGLSIGSIEVDLLGPIYAQHPEIKRIIINFVWERFYDY
jgi:hypothetical protein